MRENRVDIGDFHDLGDHFPSKATWVTFSGGVAFNMRAETRLSFSLIWNHPLLAFASRSAEFLG
jgi:hypothetical protein